MDGVSFSLVNTIESGAFTWPKRQKMLVLSQIEMIDRLVSHIPAEKNYRAIRYYSFLSNRKRGEALPLVYELLDQEELVEQKPLNYAQMMYHQIRIDSYKCILGFYAGTAEISVTPVSAQQQVHPGP
ncbi:Uncharacterised protein [Photobacterium damselae]|uniref:Transposase n=1 Tax=Photobacterium damselae TaxID=38293 RepID=A0A2X1XUS0_PHODM|nr:Uncharacterised protein [Photobacterium damselae]